MGYLITQILIYLVLAALVGFLLAWVVRGARLGQRIEELENDLWVLRHGAASDGDSQAPIRLREELDEARSECAQLRGELEQARRAADAPAPPPTPAPAQVTGRPAAATTPASERDDLTRIKGIGSKIEGMLHSLGIHHYHQIAGWSPANVEWVNERLRFKGRIQREEWIKQAKKLSS